MTAQFFDNISASFKAGEITAEHVDQWLDVLNLTPEERQAKRERVVAPDGTLVQFQVVALHRQAFEAQARPEPEPVSTEGLPEFAIRDIPEAQYDEPLPDLAGEIKKRLGIIAAVRKFGKPQDRIKDHKVEGIKVRCPMPGHNDLHPSAWCNTDKNVWTCGKCQVGGDVIDFYAATQGYDPKAFHRSGDFPRVVKEMGEQLGLHVVKTQSGSWEMVDDQEQWPSPLPDAPEEVEVEVWPRGLPQDLDWADDDYVDPPEPFTPVVPPSAEANEPVTVTTDKMMQGIAYDEDLDEDEGDTSYLSLKGVPQLDWETLPIDEDTFLHEWMTYAERYYAWVPREYFLFVGLQAVGLAMGHQVQSFTGGPLTGSLMTTLIGPSGHGKSTAVNEMRAMFMRVAPAHFDPDTGNGIKIIPSPGSSEGLIKSIHTEIEPSATTTGAKVEVGVTAWLYEDEFATLVERARRRGGGTMKTRLIQLYDFVKTKDEPQKVVEEYSMTGGLRVIHDTYFSATFTTQTDALRSMMDLTDLVSGFLNRIIPVMGPQRARRTIRDAEKPPPVPYHDRLYEALWKRCRTTHRQVIPFTDEALEMIDDHPFLHKVEKIAAYDSLYSRIFHIVCRLAFLLATNNDEKEVDVRYINAACEIGSKYLMPCFGALRGAVIATPSDDAASRIETFVLRYFEKHKEWPSSKNWQSDRSYTDYDAATRQQALEVLFNESRLVRVKIQKGKAISKVFIVPFREWSAYADAMDRRFKYEDVYA